MKLILMSFLFLTTSVFGQKLELKATGYANVSDSTKSYVVLEFPKFKQAELYKKTLTYLNGIYKNPSQVISAVDGESITVNGYDESIFTSKGLYQFPFSYNVLIQFKDGKMRFEPRITKINEKFKYNDTPKAFYIASTDSQNAVEISCIYMLKKEKTGYFLFQTDVKAEFDRWINSYVSRITKGLNDNW